MGQPAARIGDMHVCPMFDGPKPHVGGPILPACEPTVLTGGLPQARVTDKCVCAGVTDVIIKGSATVFVGGLPAARMLDATVHGGMIMMGLPTVLIGDSGGAGGGGGSGGGSAIFGAEPAASALAAASLPCMKSAAKSGSAFVAP
ncbi:PAAR domain-containing protein [Caulobacter sp. LARHSG274]